MNSIRNIFRHFVSLWPELISVYYESFQLRREAVMWPRTSSAFLPPTWGRFNSRDHQRRSRPTPRCHHAGTSGTNAHSLIIRDKETQQDPWTKLTKSPQLPTHRPACEDSSVCSSAVRGRLLSFITSNTRLMTENLPIKTKDVTLISALSKRSCSTLKDFSLSGESKLTLHGIWSLNQRKFAKNPTSEKQEILSML